MKKTNIFLFAFILLLIFGMASFVFSAPPPTEVLEIKEKSPLQVIGKVDEDVLLKDESQERGYPNQKRTMQLRIEKIIKKPIHLDLKPGEALNIVYSYIPSWIPMDGGAKMDIVVGDEIEIWLKLGEDGWEPAFGGETVNHVKYMDPRKEPIPEPFKSRLKHNFKENIELFVFAGFLLILLIIIIVSKMLFRRTK
jgi:hypothetical protein